MSGESGSAHTGTEIGSLCDWPARSEVYRSEQVEEATKIRTRYLRDLENENFDVLPAVYMLGSLKTYAAHLGLDGAAMTRELKRRQGSVQREQDQAPDDSQSGEPRGLLAYLGRLASIGGTVAAPSGSDEWRFSGGSCPDLTSFWSRLREGTLLRQRELGDLRAAHPYPFLTASLRSCKPCLASEKSIMVFSVS